MGALQVIIQSATWGALKKALYKRELPLNSRATDFSEAYPFENFSAMEVVDCIRFIDPENQGNYIDLDDCVITVQQLKNIVKTPIQGVNGTVKEYISDGDYVITLKGRISSNAPDRFPMAQASSLIDFLQLQEALPVESEYLRYVYGIYNLVAESYTMQRKEGWESIQEYEIKCISHLPVELILKDE